MNFMIVLRFRQQLCHCTLLLIDLVYIKRIVQNERAKRARNIFPVHSKKSI